MHLFSEKWTPTRPSPFQGEGEDETFSRQLFFLIAASTL